MLSPALTTFTTTATTGSPSTSPFPSFPHQGVLLQGVFLELRCVLRSIEENPQSHQGIRAGVRGGYMQTTKIVHGKEGKGKGRERERMGKGKDDVFLFIVVVVVVVVVS